jgi:diguanylate cyclase (GGDEF)-like protein
LRRAGDCAARYGGEEFAVLLPGLSSAGAVGIAEKIRLRVQQWSDGSPVMSVSIGVASLTPNATIESSVLVKAADKALYAAKAGGRNQTVLADIPTLSLAA